MQLRLPTRSVSRLHHDGAAGAPAPQRAEPACCEPVRLSNVCVTGTFVGLAAGLVHTSWLYDPRGPWWPYLRPHGQPAAVLLGIHIAIAVAALAACTASGWIRWRRRGAALQGRVWRRWYVGPVAAAVLWGALSLNVFGPAQAWATTVAKGMPYALVQAFLFAPLSVLASALLTWISAGAWTWRRPGRAAAVGLVLAVLLCAAPMGLPARRAGQPVGAQANGPLRGVVLVVIDALRSDYLSCAGSTEVRTPVIDGLASRGVRFAQAVSPSPWTLPAMGSMFTGRYPTVHGAGRVRKDDEDELMPQVRDGLSDQVPCLAEVLTREGWDCGAFVTNDLVNSEFGFQRGFATFEDCIEIRPLAFGPAARDPRSGPRLRMLASVTWRARTTDVAHCADREAVARSVDWVRRRGDRPFLLYLHLMAVHEHKLLYAASVGPHGPGRLLAPDTHSTDVASAVLLPREATEDDDDVIDVDKVRRVYASTVVFDDMLLAGLIDGLRGAGVFRDTLLIITSDHGEELGERGRVGHGHSLYDDQLRVPLILHYPSKLPAGRVVEPQVSTLDLAATILALAGVPRPPAMGGDPMFGVAGDAPAADRVAFSEFDDPCVLESVRVPPYKLIHHREDGWYRLFGLRDDPGEHSDIPGDGDPRRAALQAMHREWSAQQIAQQSAVRPSRVRMSDELRAKFKALGYMK